MLQARRRPALPGSGSGNDPSKLRACSSRSGAVDRDLLTQTGTASLPPCIRALLLREATYSLSAVCFLYRVPPPFRAGTGRIRVNGRPFDDYFKPMLARMEVMKPFELTKTLGAFDVQAIIDGGGVSGQAAVGILLPKPDAHMRSN